MAWQVQIRVRAGSVALAFVLFASLALPAMAESRTGLWVGVVEVDAVSQPRGETPVRLQHVPRPFEFVLLVHIDDAGQARLLKDAVLIADTTGAMQLLASPGPASPVIRAADARARRDALRFVSAAMVFDGPALAMRGGLGARPLEGEIVIAPDDRVNPFVHHFHPDHSTDARRGLRIVRRLSLRVTHENEAGSVVSGIFGEEIEGLHHARILAGGRFRLRRVWDGGTLIEEEPR